MADEKEAEWISNSQPAIRKKDSVVSVAKAVCTVENQQTGSV